MEWTFNDSSGFILFHKIWIISKFVGLIFYESLARARKERQIGASTNLAMILKYLPDSQLKNPLMVAPF